MKNYKLVLENVIDEPDMTCDLVSLSEDENHNPSENAKLEGFEIRKRLCKAATRVN